MREPPMPTQPHGAAPAEAPSRQATDWQAYAEVYDLLAEHNPAYQALLARFNEAVSRWPLRPGARLADLGAGTGNFSLALAEAFPACPVTHLDSNVAMNRAAERKARAAGRGNLHVLTCDISSACQRLGEPFAAGSLAALTTVHALYAFPQPQQVLASAFTWLQPGGWLLACDAGRMGSVAGWAAYVLAHHWRRHGLAATLGLYRRALAVVALNRPLQRAQREGRLWRHTPAEFRAAIEGAGFEVVQACQVYRGDSDFVVARKPAGPRWVRAN
jgi:ubiquinone/menaquinone biosynthesis C-methylase UbiE